MSVYILSYLFLFFFSNIEKKLDFKIVKYFLIIFSIFLIFLIGLRYEVGGDFDSYFKLFYVLKSRDNFEAAILTSGGDILYNILNLLVSKLGLNYATVNFLCALIFIFCLYEYSKKQKDPILTLMIAFPYLILVVSMGYVRQACAIGLFLYSLDFIINRKIVYSFFILFLATLFHKTSIILIPIVFLAINYKRIKIFIISAFIILILFIILFYRDFLGYANNYAINPIMESPGVFYRTSLNLFASIIFGLFFWKYFKINPILYNIYFYLSISSILLFVLQFYSTTLVDRLSLYIFPLQLFVFSSLPYLIKDNFRSLFTNYLIKFSYFFLLIFWLLYANHSYLWKPYKNLIFNSNFENYNDRIQVRENIKDEYLF